MSLPAALAEIFITKQDVWGLPARLLIPMYFWGFFLIFIPLFLPLHVRFSDLYSITGYTFYRATLILLYSVLFLFPFRFRLFYSILLFLCSTASVFSFPFLIHISLSYFLTPSHIFFFLLALLLHIYIFYSLLYLVLS